jgi:hypothetical protein
MEIFDYVQDGLVFRPCHEKRPQNFLEFLPLPLGTESERRIVLRQGK